MARPMNGMACGSSSKGDSKPHLLSLPSETLEAIFEPAEPRDLANLSRVSRAFRDLAAARLYRTFTHVFAEDHSKSGQLAVDHLAGILETLTTSDYNYAGYLKEILMDTASTADSGEGITSEFKYEYTCGKFLNTLLLSTLKRGVALETFRWNVRVEISQSVFAILGKMPTLQNLHVRLQPGPSLHSSSFNAPVITIPPPPPVSLVPPMPPGAHHHHHHHYHAPPVLNANPSSFTPYMQPKPLSASSDVKLTKKLAAHNPTSEPQNFSRFSGLKNLAVLDMDTLEYIPELAECVSASSTTLKSLKISFSDSLALKARKKTVVDVSDTETGSEIDEFDPNLGLPPPPPPAMVDQTDMFGIPPASTSNEADVRKQRSDQEKVLAQIFGLERASSVQRHLERAFERAIFAADREAQTLVREYLEQDEDRLFVKQLRKIAQDMTSNNSALGVFPKPSKAFEKIEKAASKYLERKEKADSEKKSSSSQKDTPAQTPSFTQSVLSKSDIDYQNNPFADFDDMEPLDLLAPNKIGQTVVGAKYGKFHNGTMKKTHIQKQSTFASNQTSTEKLQAETTPSWKGDSGAAPNSSSTSETNEVAFDNDSSSSAPTTGIHYKATDRRKTDDELSDIIDMEHPDDDDDAGEDQEFVEDGGSGADNETQSSNSGVPLFHNGDAETTDHVEASTTTSIKGKEVVRHPPGTMDVPKGDRQQVSTENIIRDYLRQNHGIPLESLSIHLIPVRVSVLCRAIDICSLKHLSLLNVGPQRNIWAMLTKLQKTEPLKLTSVHTDNVAPSLLTFLNGLGELTELFLIERSSRSKVESFASKTEVKMEDIRKQVLKRHMKSLRRLVIRNDEDSSWALNHKSVRLITRFGSNLLELAVGLDSSHFHLLMQRISGFRSLIALQIVFSSNDNCNSVLREVRSCTIDNILHCPKLQIEYVAVCYSTNGPVSNSVTQLKRVPHHTSLTRDAVRRAIAQAQGSRSGFSSSLDAGLGVKLKSKGKDISVVSGVVANAGPGGLNLHDDAVYTPDDSDDDITPSKDVGGIIINGLKTRDTVGIKMWENETWELRL